MEYGGSGKPENIIIKIIFCIDDKSHWSRGGLVRKWPTLEAGLDI